MKVVGQTPNGQDIIEEENGFFAYEKSKLNLKKLSKYMDNYNKDWDIIDVKLLIDKLITYDINDQVIFQSFFIANKTKKATSLQFQVSRYKVNKVLDRMLNEISKDTDILKIR